MVLLKYFYFSLLSVSVLNNSFQTAASVSGDTVLEYVEPTVHIIIFWQKLFRFQANIGIWILW